MQPSESVTYRVRSDTLPMAAVTTTGPASAGVTIPLAALTPGLHRLTIEASVGTRRDALVRTFRVVTSRQTRPVVESWTVSDTLRPSGSSSGLSTFLISDGGRGRFVPRLLEMSGDQGGRADRIVAALAARAMLRDTFHVDEAALPPEAAGLDAYRSSGGLAVVAYAAKDLELTVRATLAEPAAAGSTTAGWLRMVANGSEDGGEIATSEEQSVALAGLAAIGEPVIGEIRDRLASKDVTDRERLFLGLGAAALGDLATAGQVERDIAALYGQRQGIFVRLAVDGDRNHVTEATARWAALAASVGDPLADAALAYVTAAPLTDDLSVLEELTAIRALVARSSPAPTTVSWAVGDDAPTRLDLSNGGAASISVTPDQRSGLRISVSSGRAMVVGRWEESGLPAGTPAASVGLVRSVSPANVIPVGAVVRVQLSVTLHQSAPGGTYRLVDLVPSGLAPVEAPGPSDEDEQDRRCDGPWAIDGQSVEFVASARPASDSSLDCYLARVVTPGTYTWQQATLVSDVDPAIWAGSGVATVEIR